MNRKTYGLLAGLIGAGVGTWVWRQLMSNVEARPEPVRSAPDRGTVIFANTPKPSETELTL